MKQCVVLIAWLFAVVASAIYGADNPAFVRATVDNLQSVLNDAGRVNYVMRTHEQFISSLMKRVNPLPYSTPEVKDRTLKSIKFQLEMLEAAIEKPLPSPRLAINNCNAGDVGFIAQENSGNLPIVDMLTVVEVVNSREAVVKIRDRAVPSDQLLWLSDFPTTELKKDYPIKSSERYWLVKGTHPYGDKPTDSILELQPFDMEKAHFKALRARDQAFRERVKDFDKRVEQQKKQIEDVKRKSEYWEQQK